MTGSDQDPVERPSFGPPPSEISPAQVVFYPNIGHPDEDLGPPIVARQTPPPPFSPGDALAHPIPQRQHSFSTQDLEKQVAQPAKRDQGFSRKKIFILMGLLLLGILIGSTATTVSAGRRRNAARGNSTANTGRQPTVEVQEPENPSTPFVAESAVKSSDHIDYSLDIPSEDTDSSSNSVPDDSSDSDY